ncbi:carboxymuconolactone decarboxylase family protein [Streptomyces jumonjinensis]|uniref:Carboxymuconolactone decarboxylase family protein n=1 Tax=Streptomyces jumonjinensis TaxID=1945 RepID=A0A646K975_STRJU|nr:carboxymuconolactone decarboxylase family protein [Streptomyces jumonjinensis]MQS98714.1 carboxymuconolactone decarboxylase family protein [Streptomyces jumonjinensis]
MQTRMKNPAQILPNVYPAVLKVIEAAREGGVPEATLHLLHLRTSQINGCSFCVVGGIPGAKKDGETDDRLHAVSVWREAPYFTDAERAALALAEAMTRMSDRPDPVPDSVWDDAADHFDEKQLASIVLTVGLTNLFNRVNVATRQIAGPTW